MPTDAITAALLQAGLNRDESGNLTDDAKATIAALQKINSDPELTKKLESEIAQNSQD